MWFTDTPASGVLLVIGFGTVVFMGAFLYPIIANRIDAYCESKFRIEYDLFYSPIIAVSMGSVAGLIASYILDQLEGQYKTIFLAIVFIAILFPTIVFHRSRGRKIIHREE